MAAIRRPFLIGSGDGAAEALPATRSAPRATAAGAGLSTTWVAQEGQATRTALVSGSVTAARNFEPHCLQVSSIVDRISLREIRRWSPFLGRRVASRNRAG